jgi:hypothetical protein
MMADVLFVADHFVMVTTVETKKLMSNEQVIKLAWKRLADEYSYDWIQNTRLFIKSISVEEASGIPQIGDITDTGTEGE